MATLLPDAVEPASPLRRIARCIGCGAGLEGGSECPRCRRVYPADDGIIEAIDPLSGTNRIAAQLYDSPTWSRFRFWEDVFLWFQGPGQAAARRRVLRYLPTTANARVLEVGIGDGANLPLLPAAWEVFGVDIARRRLATCLAEHPRTAGRLAWAEGEVLPFEDASFDAVFTVGGPNYFRDPGAVLREMKRVGRPGAVLIAADELPDLYRLGLGYVLGLDGLDRLWLWASGLDPEFIAMVYGTPARVEAAAREAWPNHRRVAIWNRLGYCLIDRRET